MKIQREQSFLIHLSNLTLRAKMFAKIWMMVSCHGQWREEPWMRAHPWMHTGIRAKNFLTVGGTELIPTPKESPRFALSFYLIDQFVLVNLLSGPFTFCF